jgi:hypothetical protein
MFVRCPTVRCSYVSSCACCLIVLSMRLLQSLGVARASLLLFRFPFLFLSIGSTMVAPVVSAAMDVTAVAICITISIGASLLPSAASPVSRPLLSLPLSLVITSVRHTFSGVVLTVACSFVDASARRVSRVFFAKSSSEPAQLCGFSCAPSSCSLAGAGKLAPGSIRRPESIAAVRFSIAIVVVDLMCCFCCAKTFFGFTV